MADESREAAGANTGGARPDAAAPVDDAAEKEVPQDAANVEPSALVAVEVPSPGWDEALAYADYLHTDAVLLVLGVWVCAGIMLARILLDRVVR